MELSFQINDNELGVTFYCKNGRLKKKKKKEKEENSFNGGKPKILPAFYNRKIYENGV